MHNTFKYIRRKYKKECPQIFREREDVSHILHKPCLKDLKVLDCLVAMVMVVIISSHSIIYINSN